MHIGTEIYYVTDDSPYFQKATVLGETSRSWLVGNPDEWWAKDAEGIKQHARKVPKAAIKTITREQYDIHVWAVNHRWKIRELVSVCNDGDVLLQIAKLVGYKELP